MTSESKEIIQLNNPRYEERIVLDARLVERKMKAWINKTWGLKKLIGNVPLEETQIHSAATEKREREIAEEARVPANGVDGTP